MKWFALILSLVLAAASSVAQDEVDDFELLVGALNANEITPAESSSLLQLCVERLVQQRDEELREEAIEIARAACEKAGAEAQSVLIDLGTRLQDPAEQALSRRPGRDGR